MEEPTVYRIETRDKREMNMMLNAERMALALYDLLQWRHAVYNGKDYGDYKYLYKGKLYSESEFSKLNIPDEEYDENYCIKDLHIVYSRDDLERKLNYYLDNISDLVLQAYNE